MLRKFCLFFLLLCLIIPPKVYARVELDFKGFIADEANILPEDVRNDLNMTLWDLQKKSGADIAVVILNSLEGRKIENVATDIGRSYKLGKKEKGNGVVFLTAINNRELHIALGTGLENKISDADLDNIIDNDIIPYYKMENYVNGITRGTYKLAELVASVEGVEIEKQGFCPSRISNNSPNQKEHTPWWVYVFAIIMSAFSRRRKNFDYDSFGGFGGSGSFGGCGRTGRW